MKPVRNDQSSPCLASQRRAAATARNLFTASTWVPHISLLRCGFAILLTVLVATTANAQWEIATPPTTADLRGIDNVGKGIAWASGTEGTVLRTEDDGYLWQRCAVPPDAEHLDFRGIQAFDANTAVVMSSGKGPLSRLYKTTDGCQTWKLLFTNPDADGFWDAVAWDIHEDHDTIYILGDPVRGFFRLFSETGQQDEFSTKLPEDNPSLMKGKQLSAAPGEAAFAASNSLFLLNSWDGPIAFITGGSRSEFIQYLPDILAEGNQYSDWNRVPLPLGHGPSSGAFSVAACPWKIGPNGRPHQPIVIVGGDYKRPDATTATAAVSDDLGLHFQPSDTLPRGYRSAVAYDSASKTWITVGPNGTDISTDDGRNWRALRPNPALNEPADADQHWNALSLPYAVGPHGRIGKLRPDSLKPSSAAKGAKP
jgi:hypothetical protein